MSIINLNFLLLDYIVIILSIIIIIFNFWKGFINSALGLLTWVGSVFITVYSYSYISVYLGNLILNIEFFSNFEQFVSIISIIISIPLIFLISLFILKRFRKILSNDLDKQTMGMILDKFFGAIYGLVFSYILYSTLLYLTMNSSIDIINNINVNLVSNSTILNLIFDFNNNIIEIYSDNSNNN